MDENEKQWLMDIFPQYKVTVLRGDNKQQYMKAEQLISGNVTIPECGCQYHSYQNKVNGLHDQWVKEQNT